MLRLLITIFLFLDIAVAKAEIDTPTRRCNQILYELIEARGEMRDDYPKVKVIERKKNIAAYSPVNNTIIIEMEAYEQCMTLDSMSDDALAFLISHELTHFFQVHDWSSAKSTMAFYDKSSVYKAHIKNEAEADRFGAFLCYLAGYDYLNAAPLIIEKLYVQYSVQSEGSAHYPSINERLTLATDVCNMIRQYTTMYETANYLHLIGEYELSQSLYEYLLDHLDFPEIYHNAATNQLKAALSISGEKKGYPMDIIFRLNLRDGLSNSPEDLINTCIKNYKIAVNKAPSNLLSFVNLAIAYIESENREEAFKIFDQLEDIDTDSEILNKIAMIKDIVNQNRDIPKLVDPIDKMSKEEDISVPQMSEMSSPQESLVFDSSDLLFPAEISMDFGKNTRVDIIKGNKKISLLQEGDMPSQDQKLEVAASKSESEFIISTQSEDSKFKVYIKKKRV